MEWRRLIALILLVLGLLNAAWAVPRGAERLGDDLQEALPTIGLACATLRRGAGEYLGRFVAGLAVVHGLKNGLGEAEINRRPSGGLSGFPSGHTAAAAFGASYLARECGAMVPYAGPVVAVAAGFVGASRLHGDKHDIWQVLAGALIGLAADLSLRRPARRQAAWRALLSMRRFVRRRVRLLGQA